MSKVKIIITIIIVIISGTLSGCAGKEPNEIAYVVAIGLDKAESGNYKMTIQYANTTQISGGSSESGGKTGNEIVENIIVEAPNIYAGIGVADHIISKTFSLSHAKLIVFSQEIAEEGLKDVMETFIRSEELRPDVFLAVAQGEASKYLDAAKPVMEVNPAQYYELIYHKNNLVGIPSGTAKDFFFGITADNYDCALPIAGVMSGSEEESGKSGGSDSGSEGGSSGGSGEESKKSQENEKQKEAPVNEGGLEYKMKSYMGGQMAIEKKNKSEVSGSAIFKKDKIVGMMGSIETEMFKLLSGDYDHSYITLYNEKTPDTPVTIKAKQSKKPKYKVDIDNKKVKIDLFIECDLYSLPADYNIKGDIVQFEENTTLCINKACEDFMKEFSEKYDNCDILKLKEKSKSHFFTNDQYDEFKKSVNVSDFDIEVNTNFKVRRTGLVIKEESR